jgi:hypothetical protein
MAKGDKVIVLLDVGGGITERKEYVADKAGRTVEFDVDKKTGEVTIEVKGRAGTAARTAQVRGDRVIYIEEVPA